MPPKRVRNPFRDPRKGYTIQPNRQALAGPSTLEKLKRVISEFEAAGISAYVFTNPDDIAWILNLRGNGWKPNSGAFPAIAWLDNYTIQDDPQKRKRWTFTVFSDIPKIMREDKTSALWDVYPRATNMWSDIAHHIQIDFYPIDQFYHPPGYGKGIMAYDPATTSPYHSEAEREDFAQKLQGVALPSIVAYLRSRKTKYEVQGFRHCQILEGLALVKFWMELEEKMRAGEPSECDAAECMLLQQYRCPTDQFLQPSLDCISSSGKMSAKFDHWPTGEKIKNNEIYVIRAGGHYKTGTTVFARTLFLGDGTPTEEQKIAYTSVLKGLIAVHMVQYPPSAASTASELLDQVARLPLMASGYDYAHETAHGVGNGLSLREEPMGIRATLPSPIPPKLKPKTLELYKKCTDTSLTPGVVLAVHTSCTVEREFGIRLENVGSVIYSKIHKYDEPERLFEARTVAFQNVLRRIEGQPEVDRPDDRGLVSVTELHIEDPAQQFYEVKPLTCVPFERKLIQASMLTEDEKYWINNYHDDVLNAIGSQLEDIFESKEYKWLQKKCEHIK